MIRMLYICVEILIVCSLLYLVFVCVILFNNNYFVL